jgi:hypothetical protein
MTGRKAPCSDANWVHWTVHDTIQARLDSVSSATSAFAQFSPCSLACACVRARGLLITCHTYTPLPYHISP